MAGPMGFGTHMIDISESFRQSGIQMESDYDFSLDSIRNSPFETESTDTPTIRDIMAESLLPQNQIPAPEPRPTMLILAGVVFFGIAAGLRTVPNMLRRLEAPRCRNGRRRRVKKVEIRMMA
jgi:hypothetical protein